MSGVLFEQEPEYFPAKSYLLNAENSFVWFSPEWNLEFQTTYQSSYDVEDYLGRSFFDLLAGHSIRVIYQALFQLIRMSENPGFSLKMRCDRHPHRILMAQNLQAQDDGHIKVDLSYTKLEIMHYGADADIRDASEPMKMCSWCQSIFDGSKAVWVPLEKALGYFPPLHEAELPAITHGCCPACYQSLRGQIYEYSCR